MSAKLLIVGDNEMSRRLIQDRFVAEGFDVVIACSGIEALNQARKFLPELVILDLDLPDIDGLAVCDILRAQASTADVPVVLLNNYRNLLVEVECARLGALQCFDQATALDTIFASVHETLKKRRVVSRSEADELESPHWDRFAGSARSHSPG